jgi:Flp pilus assembly protein TadD
LPTTVRAILNNAIADMNRFIPEFPENYQARILRALSYRELDDVDNQLIDVETALELTGGEPQILKVACWIVDGEE